MKCVRKVLAAVAVVSLLSAGAVQAQNAIQCKRSCDNTYNTCQKTDKNSDKCLKSWLQCKKTCPK
ncbi:hypothetical protein GCM10011273_21510 [Asticcacaulis endophyticus]|jgi:hypothetical protein|uniref:ShKT domain-containing protein n=1 Tax=Asticcacaulis endophyticus TaxID=1395890 RepID=A0A918Q6P3_9CAUL|nr:hypothetical protein GCM10011273_21510 [Asticcacaulis endophyticus]